MSERFSLITAVDKLTQVDELLTCLHLVIANEEHKSFRNPHLGLIQTIKDILGDLSGNLMSLKHMQRDDEDEYED